MVFLFICSVIFWGFVIPVAFVFGKDKMVYAGWFLVIVSAIFMLSLPACTYLFLRFGIPLL